MLLKTKTLIDINSAYSALRKIKKAFWKAM